MVGKPVGGVTSERPTPAWSAAAPAGGKRPRTTTAAMRVATTRRTRRTGYEAAMTIGAGRGLRERHDRSHASPHQASARPGGGARARARPDAPAGGRGAGGAVGLPPAVLGRGGGGRPPGGGARERARGGAIGAGGVGLER